MPFSSWRRRYSRLIMVMLLATQSQAVEFIQQTYCSNQNTGMYSAESYIKYASLDYCQNECKDDYAFAISQGPDCWCSNYAPANQQAISLCDTVCPGWPYETCGSTTNNLFGYVALSKPAWGTMYPSSAAATSSAAAMTSSAVASSAVPIETTIILTSERIIVSTKAIVSTMAVVSTQVVSILVTPTPLPSTFFSSFSSSSSSSSSSSTSSFTSAWLSSSTGYSTSLTSALPTTFTSTSSSTSGSMPLTTENTQNTVAASSLQAVTIYQTLTVSEEITIVSAITPTSTPASTTSSSASSSSATTTYVEYVTVSGAVITQYITPVASQAAESSSPAVFNQSHSSRGLSGGAAAGIAIGALLGAVLLGVLFFFCCWRKRNRNNDDESGLNRNTSVLSRVGLLRRASDRYVGKVNGRGPKLQTAGLAGQSGNENAMSATTAMTMTTSRDSRPIFVDQRLNPNAWGALHPNASQSTLGSLHDHRDYSRPLEVRNPDNHVP